MINHRLEEWATKFRASKLYLRALSRKKQEKTLFKKKLRKNIEMILAALMVIVGVILMAVNNQYNKKYSNQLMQARVMFQGIALAVLFVVVWLST